MTPQPGELERLVLKVSDRFLPWGVLACALFIMVSTASTASTARASNWEWHLSGGGQFDSDPHGVLNFGLRKGPWSLQLYTDTLELRYEPSVEKGRWFVAARGEALLAGLLLAPWTSGAPNPARGYFASYAGIEGGYVRYLPNSVYAGIAGAARIYAFSASPATQVPVPATTSLVTLDATLGRYSLPLHLWARGGVDVQGLSVSPHVSAELTFRPSSTVAPRFELRAGAAHNQTDLTRTRLGGLNPYVVPLAGAGWGEWRVSNYVAGRLGLMWNTQWTALGLAIDAAAANDQIATGFVLLAGGRWRRYFLDAAVGYAPWILRQESVSRWSGFIEVGVGWGRFR